MRPRRSKMSRKEAYSKCKETKITGFYLDSCLFDLLTTGDKNFSAAAWHALDDSFFLDEMGTLKDLQNYNTTQPREDKTESDPPIKHRANSSNRNCSVSPTWAWLLTLFVFVRWQTSLRWLRIRNCVKKLWIMPWETDEFKYCSNLRSDPSSPAPKIPKIRCSHRSCLLLIKNVQFA